MKHELAAVRIAVCTAALFFSSHVSAQACVDRFLGNWTWTSSMGVTVGIAIERNGQVICTSGFGCSNGTWSCSGNSFTLRVGNYGASMNLVSRDKMVGTGGQPNNAQFAIRTGGGPAQQNTPSRPDTGQTRGDGAPGGCIEEKIVRRRGAYITYKFTSVCDRMVTFDYDDCNQDPNLQMECSVKTMSLGRRNSFGPVQNYKQAPSARNFR